MAYFEIRRHYYNSTGDEVIEELPNQIFTEVGVQLLSDDNLLYREYTYSIRSVDSNSNQSEYVYSNPIRPTPPDLQPINVTFPENNLNQINNYTVEFKWNPVNEFTTGIEGNFGYYEIEIIKSIPETITIIDITADTFILENYTDVDGGNITNFIPSEEISFKINVVDGGGQESGYSLASDNIIQTEFLITGNITQDPYNNSNATTFAIDENLESTIVVNTYANDVNQGPVNNLFIKAYTKYYEPITQTDMRVYNLDDYYDVDSYTNLTYGATDYDFQMSNLTNLQGQTFYIGLFADNVFNLIDETPELTFGVIQGCTDSNADNYEPTAGQDDNSCQYSFEIDVTGIAPYGNAKAYADGSQIGANNPTIPYEDLTNDDVQIVLNANEIDGEFTDWEIISSDNFQDGTIELGSTQTPQTVLTISQNADSNNYGTIVVRANFVESEDDEDGDGDGDGGGGDGGGNDGGGGGGGKRPGGSGGDEYDDTGTTTPIGGGYA